MGRKFQVCALSLISAFGYTTSAFAQVAADAHSPAAPAAPTVAADSKAEPNVVGAPAAPAAPPIAHEPTPMPVAPAPAAPPPTAFESLKIESKNGSANLKVGLLVQPQFEVLGSNNPGLSSASTNLFLRRTRLLVGGTLFGKIDYFFDTETVNLFKGDTVGTPGGMPPVPATGQKSGFGIGVQDAFFTYKAYEDYFKIDAGYMLPAGAHNALQGAGTLLSLEYFSNSFRHTNSFNNAGGNPVGRDAGFQVRGLVLDNHIEYRAGLFQGLRKPASATQVADRNMFRLAARVQINVFDAENAFFYAGTYLGKKKVLSFGVAYDTQSDYHHWAVDGFLDMPLGPGGLTAQVNFSKWNGGPFLNLPKQTAFMAEAGYRFDAVPISPIVNFEYRNAAYETPTFTDEARYGLGVAYWPYAHNMNLKAFYTRVAPTPTGPNLQGYNQFNLQWQLYFY